MYVLLDSEIYSMDLSFLIDGFPIIEKLAGK